MIRILIVDDEKIERSGICFLLKELHIDTENYEAVNGVKALEILEKQPIDLLLTDIKMPFMDGLELSQRVSELYPDIKIVIFSGYGEFEYARKAMKSGVDNYILKPVNPEEFEATMKQVIQDIEAKRLENEKKEKNESFIKEYILQQIINGINADKIPEFNEYMDIDFIKEYRCMMLLEFEHDFFGKKAMDFPEEIKKNIATKFDYLNLNQQQCIILYKKDELEQVAFEGIAHDILQSIENMYGVKGYIAISGIFDENTVLSEEYEKLEQLMENRFYMLSDNVFLSDENEKTDFTQMDEDVLMKQIHQDIKVKDMMGLRDHFKELCEKYQSKKNFSQVYVKFIFSNMLKDIYDMLPDESKECLESEVDKLYRTSDFTEVTGILDNNIKKLEKNFALNPQMMHREIETVKQYIYDNYDKELSVDMLAEQVYMAPSYLSHVFKNETGQNLSKFIKALRMEKAKQMLDETHNKIVNISYAVGYPNISYFCQSFREYYGVSPQKYRTQGEK